MVAAAGGLVVMLGGRRYERDWGASVGEERQLGTEQAAQLQKGGWPVGSVCESGPVSGRASVSECESGPACWSGYVCERAASVAQVTGVGPQRSDCKAAAHQGGTVVGLRSL